MSKYKEMLMGYRSTALNLAELMLTGLELMLTELIADSDNLEDDSEPGFEYSVSDTGLAVLVIDMQEFFLKNLDPDIRTKLIDSQIDVLRYCALHNIPVVVLENQKEDSEIRTTVQELKDYIDLVPRHLYIDKYKNNGFTNPTLKEILREWGSNNLYFMGVNATACIKATWRGARKSLGRYTSSAVIADSKDKDQAQYIPWFDRTGNYHDDHMDLLKRVHEGIGIQHLQL